MKADLSICDWCGRKKDNRKRNRYCSRKCYWYARKHTDEYPGYWTGKKRPDMSGDNNHKWKGGVGRCVCGSEFKNRSVSTTRCRECYLEEMRGRVGENHPRWGGGKPDCIDCGKKLSSYQSTRCESCMGDNNRLENNPNWRNGDEKKRLRSSPEYISWRMAVFERDNYTCRGCGVRGVYLEAHHIRGFAKYPDLRFVVDNGITYCEKCHAKNDKYKRRFV